MRKKKQELSSPLLKELQRELKKIHKAESYLETEHEKLIGQKERVRVRMKKEKKVLYLKDQIKRIKSRKN